jgi:hypothetical protein
MPKCFKCGKMLATDQSLQYHLNKRVQCSTLFCVKCNKQYANKIVYDNHLFGCQVDPNEKDRHSMYDAIQSSKVFLIELDEEKNVTYVSKHLGKDMMDRFMNKNIEEVLTGVDIESMYKEKDIKYAGDLECKTTITRVRKNKVLLTNVIIT